MNNNELLCTYEINDLYNFLSYVKFHNYLNLNNNYNRLIFYCNFCKLEDIVRFFKLFQKFIIIKEDSYCNYYIISIIGFLDSKYINYIINSSSFRNLFKSGYLDNNLIFIDLKIENDTLNDFLTFKNSISEKFYCASDQEICKIFKITKDEYCMYNDNFHNEIFSPFDMYHYIHGANSTKNKQLYQDLKRIGGVENINKVFGSLDKYNEILKHTISTRFDICFYRTDNRKSNRFFDFIKVEFPIYDEKWIKANKKWITIYAIERLKNNKKFTKFDIPIGCLKIYSVKRMREYISYNFCFKDELVLIEKEINDEKNKEND